MTHIFVGVDISKDWIDVYHPHCGFSRIVMREDELNIFSKGLMRDNVRVVFEATGSYDRPLACALERHKISYSRVTPSRSRQFARAMGVIGKTDRVDAQVLSEMGARMDLPVTPVESKQYRRLKALLTRRRQLIETRKQERTRLKQSLDRSVKASMERQIKFLSKEIRA